MPRRLLLVVHRWFGLAAATFLCVAGLSGALIAWTDELDAALNPALFRRAAGNAPVLGASELVRRLEQQDARVRVSYLPLALQGGENWIVRVEPRIDPATQGPYPLDFDQVFADAATGRVLARREWGAARLDRLHLMPFVYKLHSSLQLPAIGGVDIGTLLMGAIALAWVIDTLLALWLSFPSLAAWRRSLALRWSGGASKLTFDLHRSGGVWLFALVLTMAVTSVAMNLGAEVMRPLVSVFSTLARTPYEGRPAVAPGRDPMLVIGLDEAVRRARLEARRRGWVAPAGAASIGAGSTLYGVGFFGAGASHGDAGLGNPWIYIDASDGHIVAVDSPGQGSAGDVFLQAMFPLHSGRIGGLAGRVVISVGGVLVALLSATGILLWARRRRARALAARGACAPAGRRPAPALDSAMKSVSALSAGRVVKALRYSAQGLRLAWRDEAAFRQECLLFALLGPLTLWLRLPRVDTVILFALMGLVFVVELLNSGLEALVDKTSPEIHPLAGKAKDCASAAVLVAMLTLLGAWAALAGPVLLATL